MSNIVKDIEPVEQKVDEVSTPEEDKQSQNIEEVYRINPFGTETKPKESEDEPITEAVIPKNFKLKSIKEVKECMLVRINFLDAPDEIMIFRRGLTETTIDRDFFKKTRRFDPEFSNKNAPLVRMKSTDKNWELATTIARIVSNK
jgi:hypothetical protein